jgi:hypothetical protein
MNISVRNVASEYTVKIDANTFSFQVDTTDSGRYEVEAQWYDTVSVEDCSWKVLHNGNVLLNIQKSDDAEWGHPFADRAYKSCVSIDWSRWTQCGASDEDDYTDDDQYDLGQLHQASTEDCGGDERSLKNENDDEFQNMVRGLETLGQNTSVKLPSMDDVKDNMSKEDIQNLLMSCNENGCSEINLEKVKNDIHVNEDCCNEHLKETFDNSET